MQTNRTYRFSLSIKNNVLSNLVDMLWKEEVAGEEGAEKLESFTEYEHELFVNLMKVYTCKQKSNESECPQLPAPLMPQFPKRKIKTDK